MDTEQTFVLEKWFTAYRDINSLMAAGWKIVPGTVVLASIEREGSPGELNKSPRGTLYDFYVCAALERPNQGGEKE